MSLLPIHCFSAVENFTALLTVQTPFNDSRLTYLASMLLLIFMFAYMSRFLGPVKPKRPKSTARKSERSNRFYE